MSSIKQPRGATTTTRRRPRVAGERRRPVATAEPTSVAPVESVESVEPVESPSDGEPGKAPKPKPKREPRVLFHPPRRTQRWLWPLTALTVLALAFGATATIEKAQQMHRASAQASANDAAASAASTAAQNILSYSYRTIDADLAAGEQQMTPALASTSMTPKLVSQLKSLADQRKLVVKSSVLNAAVLECGDDCSTSTVRVLLFIEQSRTGAGKPLQQMPLARSVFTMTNEDGRWLVSDMVDL